MIRASGHPTNGEDCVHATCFWHLQIHQDDVWQMLSELFDTLTPIGSLRHQFHVRLAADERRNSVSKECLWAFSLPMMMKNLQFRTATNRAATARSGNDLANF